MASRANPTDRELAILQALWDAGPSTVQQVVDALHTREGKRPAYTTVLTFLRIATEKGLTVRDETGRSHVYTAAVTRDEVERSVVDRVIDGLFRGSAVALAAKAVETRLSRAERQQLLEILQNGEES